MASRNHTILRCKIALIGDAKTGKSALDAVYREGGSKYPRNYSMTQGVEVQQKAVRIPDTDVTVELYIIDTSGNEIYGDIVNSMMEGLNYVICCYDVTNAQSFRSCNQWIQRAQKIHGSEEQSLSGALVALKADQSEYLEVTQAEAQRLADSHGFQYSECSAATGNNVDQPFTQAAQHFYEAYQKMIKEVQELAI